jgi:lipopolysaccharide/colanic/teichoic acid biosynthesis glycosyltransferase
MKFSIRGEIVKIAYLKLKRLSDILISIIILLLLFPILLVVSIWIKVDSSGPIFYKQERIGYNQKIFIILKFRTMTIGADKHTVKYKEVMLDDIRITSSGKLLRRLKLDEIVQLWNVIKGDMSLVGPRPMISDIMDDLEQWELIRFCAKPGLTGLAQINGNIYLNRLEKSYYDVEYVNKIDLFMDVKIMLKTVLVVLFGEIKFLHKPDIEERGTV